jgi:hypothetical protein
VSSSRSLSIRCHTPDGGVYVYDDDGYDNGDDDDDINDDDGDGDDDVL